MVDGNMHMKVSAVSAIILAGGTGERFGSTIPKPFLSLNGKPVIQHSIDVIEPLVHDVIVVADEPYRDYSWARAGQTRSESARNGTLAADTPYILIHDAVRPFITGELVQRVIDAVISGRRSVDTAVPIIDGYLEGGVPKSKKARQLGQTPEAFHRDTLLDAFDRARHPYDDEVSMVWDVLRILPYVIEGIPLNTKLTYAKDLENAEGILRYWNEPLTEMPPLGGAVLVIGAGDIGKALRDQVPFTTLASRDQIDVTRQHGWIPYLYRAIVYTATNYTDNNLIMEVNFTAFTRLIDYLRESRWQGNVVVYSSTAATYGRPGMALYSASKAALNAYIEATHDELASVGIYLNAIAPAKVQGKLQATLNPNADPAQMLTPAYVAERTLPYLDTKTHGHIVYLRVGL
jgi:2-C-methyl-D-erythritol 4-phosphate cytidylyltransferase